MLSSVLNSERSVLVNIEIMRAFVKLRQMLASNADLSRRELERKFAIGLLGERREDVSHLSMER